MKRPLTFAACPILALGTVLTPLPALADTGHHPTSVAPFGRDALALVLAVAEDHAHQAPHGGLVRTVGSYHYELLVKGDRILVYLLDDSLKTLAPAGQSGRAILQIPGKGKQTVVLRPQGDHFEGAAALGGVRNLVAIVSLTQGGKAQAARFVWRK